MTGQRGLARIMTGVIASDAIEFANQHLDFYLKPIKQLNGALEWAETSEELNAQYDAFVADMVYATKANTPSFREALNVFSKTLRNTLSLITSANIESEMMQVLRLKN